MHQYANHPELTNGFYAFAPNFNGGVTVAVGDMDGDGIAQFITSAGAGGGPHVKVFDGLTLAVQQYPNHPSFKDGFYAYEAGATEGVRVAALDVDRNGRTEFAVGPGPGPGSPLPVRVLDGLTLDELDQVFPFGPTYVGGVYVGGGPFAPWE